jgi:nitrous oxidase accessory protein NosD
VWHVYEGQSIQDAVDAATPGDKIIVHPGIYNESVVITTDCLTLKGGWEIDDDDDNGHAIMDGTGAGVDAFRIKAHYVTIQGFEMRNYTGSGSGEGNGVQAWNDNSDFGTVRNNWIHDNTWNAVLVGNEGTSFHTGWILKNNLVSDHGSYSLELTNCVDCKIEHNTVSGGIIGIVVQARRSIPDGIITASNIEVKHNIVSGTAYGLYAIGFEGHPTGFYSLPGAFATLEDVKIEHNKFNDNILGMIVWGYNKGVLRNATIAYNKISTNSSHGMYLLQMDESQVSHNRVTKSGGSGIYLRALFSTSDGNRIEHNQVSGSGSSCDLDWDKEGMDNCWEKNIGTECPDPLPACDEDILLTSRMKKIGSTFALFQNSPNPFNQSTAISYKLSAPTHISLKIYDMTGRLVKILVDEPHNAGFYQLAVTKDQLPGSGIYFYRLSSRNGQASNVTLTGKLILMR